MPPHVLFDMVIDCLNRKLHVFIEKPPGVIMEQTRQMALLAEKNKCLTMVSFQRRFQDNNEEGTVLVSSEIAGSKDFHKTAGFYAENRHFIDCIKEKKNPMTNFFDALKTMELVDRIYHTEL